MKRASLRLLCLLVLLALGTARAGSYEDWFSAVQRDDAAAIEALLRRGFDPNTRDPQGQVGLFLALRADAAKVADLLMRQSATQADVPNANEETPLMMAALRGRLEWCKRLVTRGAGIERSGWTPLHYAATGPGPEVVQWLLEQRARVDARSPNGTTPLMMAAGYGTEAAADALLKRGADPTLRNDKGLTAADFARSVGRDKLAIRLERGGR